MNRHKKNLSILVRWLNVTSEILFSSKSSINFVTMHRIQGHFSQLDKKQSDDEAAQTEFFILINLSFGEVDGSILKLLLDSVNFQIHILMHCAYTHTLAYAAMTSQFAELTIRENEISNFMPVGYSEFQTLTRWGF